MVSLVVPRVPHFFGGERQKRSEQTLEDGQRDVQGGACRGHRGVVSFAVRTGLYEFDVVVTEGPKEGFGALQDAGVVVVLERRRGLTDQGAQQSQDVLVQRRRHVLGTK